MEGVTPRPRDIALQVMLVVTLVDGQVSDDELTRVRWLATRVGADGAKISEADVRVALERLSHDGFDFDAYLASVAPLLNEDEKRLVLKAAFIVACADGRVDANEDALIGRIGRALGISPAAYRATLRHMVVGRDL